MSLNTSANTLTEDPDTQIIRISEPESSYPYYPYYSDIRIMRISELYGYSKYPDIRLSRNYGLYIALYKPYI